MLVSDLMRKQFYEFFNLQLHQLYQIDVMTNGYYKVKKIPFVHNDLFEKAVTDSWNVRYTDQNDLDSILD